MGCSDSSPAKKQVGTAPEKRQATTANAKRSEAVERKIENDTSVIEKKSVSEVESPTRTEPMAGSLESAVGSPKEKSNRSDETEVTTPVKRNQETAPQEATPQEVTLQQGSITPEIKTPTPQKLAPTDKSTFGSTGHKKSPPTNTLSPANSSFAGSLLDVTNTLNMSFSLRSPPGGIGPQVPPGSMILSSGSFRKVQKSYTALPDDKMGVKERAGDNSPVRAQSLKIGSLPEQKSELESSDDLPFIPGIKLCSSEASLVRLKSNPDILSPPLRPVKKEVSILLPSKEIKEKDEDEPEGIEAKRVESMMVLPKQSADSFLRMKENVTSPLDIPAAESESSDVSEDEKERKRYIHSFKADYFARTFGGGEYGIRVEVCENEPSKLTELSQLQGKWFDSAMNKWFVTDRAAKVELVSGSTEEHILEDAPDLVGRITLMGALVARHEWSQIVWTDHDVWQQVWECGADVDVYYGDDEGWYGGKVKDVLDNGMYTILFEDGEEADGIEGGHMRNREKDLRETVHLLPPINPHI